MTEMEKLKLPLYTIKKILKYYFPRTSYDATSELEKELKNYAFKVVEKAAGLARDEEAKTLRADHISAAVLALQ